METPALGCTTIRGATANPGHEVGRKTTKRSLKDAAIRLTTEA
jgi:hypothetical protein